MVYYKTECIPWSTLFRKHFSKNKTLLVSYFSLFAGEQICYPTLAPGKQQNCITSKSKIWIIINLWVQLCNYSLLKNSWFGLQYRANTPSKRANTPSKRANTPSKRIIIWLHPHACLISIVCSYPSHHANLQTPLILSNSRFTTWLSTSLYMGAQTCDFFSLQISLAHVG